MAPHSSTLAWKIPWTEEPGRLQSMGSLRLKTRLSNFTFPFHCHALEKAMAPHSSVLAWRIPGTGEPGGLASLGSHRVGHDWSNWAAAAAAYCVLLNMIVGKVERGIEKELLLDLQCKPDKSLSIPTNSPIRVICEKKKRERERETKKKQPLIVSLYSPVISSYMAIVTEPCVAWSSQILWPSFFL